MSMLSAASTIVRTSFPAMIDTKTKYHINKNIYSIFDKDISFIFANAQPVKDSYNYTIYYNSNFSFDNLVSCFTWSNNLINKYVKTDNNYLNELNISGNNTLLSTYNALSTAIISAYTKNINNIQTNLSTICTLNISTIVPKFNIVSSIYYSYQQISSLLLSDYGIKFQKNQNFGNYLQNTLISSTNLSSNLYTNILLSGKTNNQSYLIFNKNYENNNEFITIPINYCFNIKNNQKYNLSSVNLYPVYTYMPTTYFVIENNDFDTYINLINSNISSYNCTSTQYSIDTSSLINTFYQIDKNNTISSVTDNDIYKSNLYKITFNTYANQELYKDPNNNQLINTNSLSCIRLNDFEIKKDYNFKVPYVQNNYKQYQFDLKYYTLTSGNNEIFDFNFIDENNKNINIFKRKILSNNKIELPVSAIISTSIVSEYKKCLTGLYTIQPQLLSCKTITETLIFQKNKNYNLFTLLSATDYTDTYTSTSISSNYGINNLIFNNDDFIISSCNLKYKPVINYTYPNLTLTNYHEGQQLSVNLNIYLPFKFKTNNLNYDVYLSDKDLLSSFKITNDLLSTYLDNDIMSSFEAKSNILNLSSSIKLNNNILSSLLSTSLSTYIKNNNLQIYNISGLTQLKNNYSLEYNMYYNLCNDTYLKVPNLIFGCISQNNLSTIYKLNNQYVIYDNKIYNFKFNNELSTKIDNNIAKLQICDDFTSATLNYNLLYFTSAQYIIFKDHDLLSTNYSSNQNETDLVLDSISDCNKNNYNIYPNGKLSSDWYYNTAIGISANNISSLTYGCEIYNNTIEIQKTYTNYNNLHNNWKIDKLYTAYIPAVSTFTYSNDQDRITTYEYPQISSNYFYALHPDLNTSALICSFDRNTMFNSKIKAMYSSFDDIINNISTTSIKGINYTCQLTNDLFKINYVSAIQNQNNPDRIDIYFKTNDKTQKIGLVTIYTLRNNK